VIALLFLYFGLGLFGASLAFLLSYIIIFFISFYIIRKRVNFLSVQKDNSLGKQILNFSWPIMLSSFVYILLNKIDIMFIGHFIDASTVGKYSVSSDLSHLLIVLNSVLLPIFFPVMSHLIHKGKIQEAGNIFRKTTKFLVVFTLPALLVFLIFSEEILFYLFGSQYAGAGIFLFILSFASLFAVASGPIDMFLKSMNKPKWVLANSLVAIAVNIVLNYVLIIKMGAIGVAIATVSSIFLENYLGIFQIWLLKKIKPYDLVLIRPIIVSAIIGVAFYFVKINLPSNLYINIVVALSILVVYGIYLLSDKKLINIREYIQKAKRAVLK
jgi:O-antigen/teichoic acid export membrane protein